VGKRHVERGHPQRHGARRPAREDLARAAVKQLRRVRGAARGEDHGRGVELGAVAEHDPPPGRRRADGADPHAGTKVGARRDRRVVQPLDQAAPTTVEVAHTAAAHRFGHDVRGLLVEVVRVGREARHHGEGVACPLVGHVGVDPGSDRALRVAGPGVGREPGEPGQGPQPASAGAPVDRPHETPAEEQLRAMECRAPARQVDPELLQDRRPRSAGGEPVRAEVEREPVAFGGTGTSAGPAAAVEHGHRNVHPGELQSCGQAGQAGADDDHTLRVHRGPPGVGPRAFRSGLSPPDDAGGRSVTSPRPSARTPTDRRPTVPDPTGRARARRGRSVSAGAGSCRCPGSPGPTGRGRVGRRRFRRVHGCGRGSTECWSWARRPSDPSHAGWLTHRMCDRWGTSRTRSAGRRLARCPSTGSRASNGWRATRGMSCCGQSPERRTRGDPNPRDGAVGNA
jgi:hypothetical protein